MYYFKQHLTAQTGDNGTKDFDIIVPLKYLRNFWRTLEMVLINCEISLMLTLPKNYFLVAGKAANQKPTFEIIYTMFYVPAVTLSSQDNVKLLKQLESGFK